MTLEATCILEPGSRTKVTFYIELLISLKLKISDVKKNQKVKIHISFFVGHHFQANYAHAHHVMHKIRRKKKTSVCSDDGVDDDGEADHKKHGKRRGSKKEEIHHLPTIDDETKPQVLF